MPTKTSANNGAEETAAELEFDIDEMREALGVPALEARIKALEALVGEQLTYINYVDLSLQELQGEPVVTERLKYNVGRSGRLEFQRQRPPAPANLTNRALKLVTEDK